MHFTYGISRVVTRMIMCAVVQAAIVIEIEKKPSNYGCFTLLQVVFSLPIGFSKSSEGSVIEMKPTAPLPIDTAVSLKAKCHHNEAFNFLSCSS